TSRRPWPERIATTALSSKPAPTHVWWEHRRVFDGDGPMSDVTVVLDAVKSGDPEAPAQLLPLVYEELRRLATHRLAHESPGHSLQGTDLVHEAYLRLVDEGRGQHWDSRGHFFAAAA